MDRLRPTYLRIMLILMFMIAYFYGVLLWAGVRNSANAGRAVAAGVCLLVALSGNLLGKARRNFYIGARTPWSLADERVWNKTHRLAAKTLVMGGMTGLALSAVGVEGWAIPAALIVGAIIPAVYSLIYYKQLERRGEL